MEESAGVEASRHLVHRPSIWCSKRGHQHCHAVVWGMTPPPQPVPPPSVPPLQLSLPSFAPLLPKDKPMWSDLTELEKVAAHMIGYDALSWQLGLWVTQVMWQNWQLLPSHVRTAAQVLGYTQSEWDAEIGGKDCA